ncbi:MAG TPA: hypothetical protein VD932_08665 [Aquabacterium sp.]|nr:hypothetical protein [Aquabacterium sp.]
MLWMRRFAPVAAAVVIVFVVWASWAMWGVQAVRDRVGADNVPALGQVGDLFGGINALFAALALVGVCFAAFFQWRSFQLLLDERTQNAFEPRFFHLLQLVRDVQPTTWTDARGHISLTSVTNNAEGIISHGAHEITATGDWAARRKVCLRMFRAACQFNDHGLQTFLDTLWVLLRQVRQSPGTWVQKREFAAIVRASVIGELELRLLVLDAAHRADNERRGLLLDLDIVRFPDEHQRGEVYMIIRVMLFEHLLAGDDLDHMTAALAINRSGVAT